ncbi:MAG TPA: TraB/GumN family protein [Allosphingosinicella sp.]
MIDGMKKLGLLAALALYGCATTAAEAPAGPKPAMWVLSDSDTRIYLFGTFHLLPKGYAWRSAKIDEAIAESSTLVTEIGDIGDPAASAGTMMSLGVSPGLPPIMDRVPEDKKDELREMIAESGIPAVALDRLETWAAAMALIGVTFKRLELDPDAGVESGLHAGFKQAGKPIEGLETIAQQFGFFDKLPEDAQRAFLAGMLDDPAEMKRLFERMTVAWSSGDVEDIAATFNEQVDFSPVLRERLLAQRNAAWAEWLEKRLEKPGTIMVAVGAGHLAGRDSVQDMLAKKGLKTKRVQ